MVAVIFVFDIFLGAGFEDVVDRRVRTIHKRKNENAYFSFDFVDSSFMTLTIVVTPYVVHPLSFSLSTEYRDIWLYV